MQVDPKDKMSVLELQIALAKLIPRVQVRLGWYDDLTLKMVERYQIAKQLPRTGQADEITLRSIERDLEQEHLFRPDGLLGKAVS
jgi:Putative peptidoglycan binding domain